MVSHPKKGSLGAPPMEIEYCYPLTVNDTHEGIIHFALQHLLSAYYVLITCVYQLMVFHNSTEVGVITLSYRLAEPQCLAGAS